MKIHFSTAHFGTRAPKNCTLLSNFHDLTQSHHDDHNTPSRSLAMHPRLKGKVPKMLAHREHAADWYVWMDSTFVVLDQYFLDRLLDLSTDQQILLYAHPHRRSISEERDFIVNQMSKGDKYLINRYKGEPISEQVDYYIRDPRFIDNNLFAMGFFAYHKSAIPLFEEWFIQNVLWSIQDQISFPYVLSQYDYRYSLISDGTIFQNSFVSHKFGRKAGMSTKVRDLIRRYF